MRTFRSAQELVAAAGSELGYSGWRTITQERIGAFADATDDHQWIHVDQERAAAGPFHTTIAHGLLTLSLVPSLLHEIYTVEGSSMGINYGLDHVRFPAPLPSGADVRAHALLKSADEQSGRVRLVTGVTVEIRGGDKPVCVADFVSLRVF
jgi:acyl dehydratase